MDILSHTFEYYFNGFMGSDFQLRFSEAIILSAMRALEGLVSDPLDVRLRGEMMWCSTVTWGNGLTKIGRQDPDMTCHSIEESFSGHFDTHHGGCLGVLTPRWMRFVMKKKPDIFARFARNVMGIVCPNDHEAAVLGVDAYISWLKRVGAPQCYSDLSNKVAFTDEDLLTVAKNAWRIYKGRIGRLVTMDFDDIVNILMEGKAAL
jgi:alcohol dehydrogenase YqhD (iron-dependent ADH family)